MGFEHDLRADCHVRATTGLYREWVPSAPYARVLRRRHLRGAAPVVVAAAALAVPAVAGALARASSLHVAISVPSVLSSNGRQVWVANTGTSSVLELTANGGREVLDVKGAKLRLDNSDAIAQYGNDVWVANAASDTVTEFYAKSGALKHVLAGPKFHFAVPLALVAADRHVFVLATAGDKVTEVNETSGRLVRYLQGARFHFHAATAMTRAGDNVWVVSTGGGGSLTELARPRVASSASWRRRARTSTGRSPSRPTAPSWSSPTRPVGTSPC